MTVKYHGHNYGHQQITGDRVCSATTTARTDADDIGKWRQCELEVGHEGDHKTTYCGRPYCWPNADILKAKLENDR